MIDLFVRYVCVLSKYVLPEDDRKYFLAVGRALGKLKFLLKRVTKEREYYDIRDIHKCI